MVSTPGYALAQRHTYGCRHPTHLGILPILLHERRYLSQTCFWHIALLHCVPSALVCMLEDDQDSVPEPTPGGRVTDVCQRRGD